MSLTRWRIFNAALDACRRSVEDWCVVREGCMINVAAKERCCGGGTKAGGRSVVRSALGLVETTSCVRSVRAWLSAYDGD